MHLAIAPELTSPSASITDCRIVVQALRAPLEERSHDGHAKRDAASLAMASVEGPGNRLGPLEAGGVFALAG